ncbi:MAG TPA: serine/threonine-protein kinase, partial [Gemmatimonadales bacterium]|nr:serine/threonine-protein kinase [Gemmatimonadales bacterium]
ATDEAVWYAMEYVQGRSLGDLLRTADRMDLKTCLRLVEQIASALEYGHRRGITHGNLKRANILVDPEGWDRVAGFGLSSAFSTVPRRQPELSIEENFGHSAPERFGSDGVCGPASDQYALAVLTFACLARRPPFVGETLDEIMVHHLEGPVPLLAESRPDLPASVSAALARAMKHEPEDRFAGVLDLATALAGVSSTEPAVLPLPLSRAPEPVAGKSAMHPLLKLIEAERHTHKPEPAKSGAPAAAAAAASAAPVKPAVAAAPAKPAPPVEAAADEQRPPLLLVDREGGRESRDDLEVVDEDKEEARERVARPVPDDDEDDDDVSGQPVLLWPARENAPPDDHAAAAAAAAAAAMAGEHLNGEDRTPLLFPDQPRPARPGPNIGARIWDMAHRWTALPRSTRIGSSAAAAVILMALVWWRVAKGHEEPHGPVYVNATPTAGIDTPKAVTPPRNQTRRQPGSAPGTQAARPPRTTAPVDSGRTTARPPVTPTAAEPAHLFINSTPWGVLYVDDRQIGNTPQADLKVAPGSHSIRVSRDGYVSYETVITIESGETLKLTDIVLPEKPQ